MSWSDWYLRNSSISAILRSVIGVVTPFRLLVVLLLEGNAPVTFSVNHRPDSTGFYTLPGTLTKADAPCPSCGRVSRSRHSSYTRLLMDLPADGRTVNIQLVVRRFRCKNPSCRRRVFAERFPRLVRTHARRTERLESLLTRIG